MHAVNVARSIGCKARYINRLDYVHYDFNI